MDRNINKKIIIAGLILVLLFSFYLYISFRPSKTTFLYQMNGRIEEIKEGFITVSGTAKSLDPNNLRQESKTTEFEITPQTIFKANALIITSEQLKNGGTFSPETQQRPGAFSDLTNNTVVQVWSKDDLFTTNKAVAIEIHYIFYDFPKQ